MRRCFAVVAVSVLVSLARANESWQVHTVARTTNAWYALRADAVSSGDSLTLRQEGKSNGFLLPREARQRQTVMVETDVRVRERLGKEGWNFAGVTLHQDEANYWMLALVEGPDGTHSVDFIENHAGVWHAQNEPKTALKREGNVSFAWKSGVAYRLRLMLREGRVSASICDPSDGHVFGAAAFALQDVPAVRSGYPGLIAHASVADCTGFSFGLQGQTGDTRRPAVALLDDDLLGHDRAANAKLAGALEKKGFAVVRLSAEQLIAPGALNGDAFQILVVPQCDSAPALLGPAAQQFEREGGHLVFIGGPFLDRSLWKVGGRWLDKEGQRQLLQAVSPAHRPFEIGAAFDAKAWRRSCADSRTPSTFRVVNEGPGNAPCLRLDIQDLLGWDNRQSPALKALFGAGDSFFCFMGKGDERTSQLAVEISERDGSRWIATAPLATEWRRIGLRLEDFRYWKDSHAAKGRGHPGDRLNPREALHVNFGLSSSHTSAVGGGEHAIWLADVGTAPDPLAAAGIVSADMAGSLETVYPRYKVHLMSGANGSSVVCAIPRTLGEGFGRGNRWRFLPRAKMADKANASRGVCEWLLLNNRLPLEGTVIAGFGYTDPAVWASPEIVARVADACLSMASGVFLEEAGTEQFAYWPGEPVRLGARVRVLGDAGAESEIRLEVQSGDRVVWSERVQKPLARGLSEICFTWMPPKEPGAYRFTARLGEADEISHGFAVLDPDPAAKADFMTVKDGDFWLHGEKWYPVGVNFWPLYISGMDQADYQSGWLRDVYYSPTLVERDLKHMAEMGITMVSIQTPPIKECRNLLDFLRLCAAYNIHANLYVGSASPLAFSDAELKAYLETARLPGNATVFAYDTIWEPGNHVFRDDAARSRWDADWRAWIDERYGSAENAEKDWGCKARRDKAGNVISPPDAYFREDGAWRGMMAAYRRFMDNLTSRLWGQANRRLRELDPNHLVSFRQGNTLPYDFALSGPVKHIDFICPEGYSIRDTDEGEDAIGFITRYVDFTTHGKPIVWSEFGQSVWDNGRMAPDAGAVERQGRYSERFYRTALEAGANGTVPWWWVGGYRVDERSDFGILEPDHSERPSARLIRTYGPRLKAPREKPQPGIWFEFDRDANAGGYWRAAFNEGAAAYRAAKKAGKTLGVRTAGTGLDSATVPLVAVGNVPCTGHNPPKYLDAEFNALRVLNADNVWQEAADGVEIAVAAGQPVRVRASAGNTQEATWLPGAEAGGVALVVRIGDRAERWPVKQRVPYLQDADWGEFVLIPKAEPGALRLRAQLEAQGRAPFGEARAFTLRTR